MTDEKELIRISKYLSLVLRHKPALIGITLDNSGWAKVDELLQNMQAKGWQIDRDVLSNVVATNNKKRFALSEDGCKIRASQGHSIDVSLGYIPLEPPGILYHGTAEKYIAAILLEGLVKQSRQHVHLSTDIDTARQVGMRHGSPVVLKVMAGAMYKEGYLFFCSENKVWLTEEVPPRFLTRL
jgi:putative RNA 2'-phosphotransferase